LVRLDDRAIDGILRCFSLLLEIKWIIHPYFYSRNIFFIQPTDAKAVMIRKVRGCNRLVRYWNHL